MRLQPAEAALKIVEKRFPSCAAAVLAGSVVRGEGTPTSDLDLVIFDESIKESYRESFVDFGWPVEAFVHNFSSYRYFFEEDCKSGTPSMPRMTAEGIVLKGKERLVPIKKEASALLEKGPEPLTQKEIDSRRYFITDALDDFTGCANRAEGIHVAGNLAELLHEFVLLTNGRYIGKSKWIHRALKQFDEHLAESFFAAFEDYYRQGEKDSVIRLADDILKPYGGRFFEGFSLGKNE
ncbi:nucleotidyltransferase domain-containing protein [Metabacillus indicus]|uniref:Nucleotidyltransferase n=1 Tax=Metabacillus indicus TaxID=246786 RepID=A0A084GZP8_METID|nr:nucleotidyltransferase domain-containing protein [Metabacillus indicus]KEZ50480.1 nucleotidyltransferase [Metabacillus indicus LMG 22858]KEZ52810.1 nucleotidyltransferase [Metabacillus indicus]